MVCFSLLSIWSCCLLCSAVSGHFGLTVTVLFYVAIFYRMKAATATTQERTILKTRGYAERVLHDPSRIDSECVSLGLPTVQNFRVWVGSREGTKAFLSDAKLGQESNVGLIHQGSFWCFLFSSPRRLVNVLPHTPLNTNLHVIHCMCNSSWKIEFISCL